MNVFLMQLLSKWVSLFAVALISFVPGFETNERKFELNNKSKDMSLNVVTEITEFKTKYIYSRNIPSNIKKTIQEGKEGVLYYSLDNSMERKLRNPIDEIIELGTGPNGEFKGKLTGYGPDCPGCSEKGYVACKTYEKKKHSLYDDGITYEDYEFGEVRILAASRNVFPCGTIVLVDNGILEPFYGVVLDTGHAMRQAWENSNKVLMDLAFETQSNVSNATSNNTKFSVQRWGW